MNALSSTPRQIEIGAQEFARLKRLAIERAGLQLGEDRFDFVTSRLESRLRDHSLNSYEEYACLLESGEDIEALQKFVESLTTHTTSFFREKDQYNWMSITGLNEIYKSRSDDSREVVVWSAACSTGQELYSAMMIASEIYDKSASRIDFKGVGTDVSRQVVSQARKAIYWDAEISSIPIELRRKYLLTAKAMDGRHRIAPSIRQRTEWRVANLLQPHSLNGIEADLVMLRNVLIYFDEVDQERAIRAVLSRLKPGGYLLTGHTETAKVRSCNVSAVHPTIFRKAE